MRTSTMPESTWPIKAHYLCRSWTILSTLRAVFWRFRKGLLCLRVAHAPRSRDLAIFMWTTDKTDCFTPCACVQGNYVPACLLNVLNHVWWRVRHRNIPYTYICNGDSIRRKRIACHHILVHLLQKDQGYRNQASFLGMRLASRENQGHAGPEFEGKVCSACQEFKIYYVRIVASAIATDRSSTSFAAPSSHSTNWLYHLLWCIVSRDSVQTVRHAGNLPHTSRD